MSQQPRMSSSASFAATLTQNIVMLLDELDQLRAEVEQLRKDAAERSGGVVQ